MTFRRVSGNARYPHFFHAARYKASPMSPLRGACYPSDLANSLVRRAHHRFVVIVVSSTTLNAGIRLALASYFLCSSLAYVPWVRSSSLYNVPSSR